jgi:type IV secretion system protein VirD4
MVRVFGDAPWTFRTRDFLISVTIIAAAIEAGDFWHQAKWRSFDESTSVPLYAVFWIPAAYLLALFACVFVTIALVIAGANIGNSAAIAIVPDDMPPALKIVVYGFSLGLVAALWRFRVWIAARKEEGFSAFQIGLSALKVFFLFLMTRASRAQLFIGGALGICIGGVLFWVALRYLPFNPVRSLGPEWHWLRWLYVIIMFCLIVWMAVMVVGGLIAVTAVIRGSPNLNTDTHGQARFAWQSDLRRARLMPHKSGIYLGQFFNSNQPKKWGQAVEYPDGVHLITIGRTGSGKGTGLIIPNLSTLQRSIIIIDPKGEAAAITARKRATFGRVVILNPFNLLTEKCPWLNSNGFNPLATVRSDDNFVDDCTIIGQSLVKQEESGNGRFFSGSAHDLVTAFVMHEILTRGAQANLANVRTMLTEPWGGDERSGPTGIAKTIAEMTLSPFEPLRSKAGRFRNASNSTRDVISTATNETSFIDSPQIAKDLSSGKYFRFAEMKEFLTTVYLILPATHLESHSNWLRLIIASALRELLASPANGASPPVLFMLDEFAQLGHLPAISTAMNIARSFGVQLWPFVHDMNQLKNIYGENWENFLGASAALTAFAPRDLFTAQHLSKLCGNKTIIVESQNDRTGANGTGSGRAPQGVPLIRQEELRAMPPGQMLCFVDPVAHPFMARAPGYWETKFKRGLDDNPYYQG